jgi:exopolysaccharide biosynthesis polyprenyl glycosylphosphotransferase
LADSRYPEGGSEIAAETTITSGEAAKLTPLGTALPADVTGVDAEELAAAARRRRAVIRRRDSLYRRSLGIADMWAIGVSLLISGVAFGDDRLTVATLAIPLLFVVLVKAMGLYDRDEHLLHKTTLDEVPTLFGIATLTVLLLWLSDGLLIDGQLGRPQVLGTWVLLFVLMVAFRALARMLASRVAPVERCLLIGDPKVAEKLRHMLAVTHAARAELVGVVPTEGPPVALNGVANGNHRTDIDPNLGRILTTQEIDRVIITTGPEVGRDDLLYIIRELKAYGVKVSVLPEASRVAGSSLEIDHLHGLTLLGVRRFEFPRSSKLIKRSFDIAGSALLLALLSPFLLAIALAIRLDSSGPILFRQRRVGRHGGEFRLIKFRSMVDGADERKHEYTSLNEGAEGLFKIFDDPRVTRVGRVLRRYQLDELPQLLNVFRGEMSLVGPRPLIPEEDSQIHGWYRRRLDVPPGMTGHWQVLGSSASIPLDEMVKLDYLYVANWSPWNDVKLLMRTVPFVFGRRGL